MTRTVLLQRPVTGALRLGVRAHSSPRTRRVVPVALAFRAAEPYAALARRARGMRYERFRSFHEQLLLHTPLRGTEESVAERAAAEMFRSLELFWRPWLVRGGTVDGIEHVHAARAGGRGAVMAFPHFGLFYAHYPLLPRFGVDAWAVTGRNHFVDMGDGYMGRFSRQGRAYIDEAGPGRAIVTGGAFDQALRRLLAGSVVSIAFDLVGSTPTPFLGRRLSLASGASRLAFEAGVQVVPMVVRRLGNRPLLRFAAPIDPADHSDAVALQAAVARVMERWALELPEAVWPLVHNGTPLIQGPRLGA